ncbi:Gfo/Idh/MocA family protein [Pararhizobium sp. DWP3-4]|uniref:Gfo/Idh/MocA family protein n=1 Tax=Pararhizobium sp. DWP3-4 TaxID=2804565 RepID=UPI003CF4C7FD
MRNWRVAGINFDHMHMGDLLREVYQHPEAEIVGVCDKSPERMQSAIASFNLGTNKVFHDVDRCVEQTKPDLVILCAATADHADYVEQLAKYRVHVLVEKPFAASIADSDRMTRAVEDSGKLLAVNWPLAWYPCHVTAKRLIDDGAIGEVIEVHFYDGNRGPLYHLADKAEVSQKEVEAAKPSSWWYKHESGGGSLRDYLGYGTTLGTWFMNGEKPVEVTCVVDQPAGLEVDEHSITICRYQSGLSKFETRWGTFTDPWTQQPQPKCGFVIVGSEGTISSFDYEQHVTVQTRQLLTPTRVEADVLQDGHRSAVEYVIRCMETGNPIVGPLDPAISRIGQQIIDSAVLSAREKRTVGLLS